MGIPAHSSAKASGPVSRKGIDPEVLARANINPVTGLATDYLNHFNEAIMLLEMLSSMPDCIADFIAWRPMSYHEHFAASRFKDRELAIAAYDIANPAARERLDQLADAMNDILQATREALTLQLSPEAAGTLAQEAAASLKPLVARAGAVIHGQHIKPVEDTADDVPQAAIDALFEH